MKCHSKYKQVTTPAQCWLDSQLASMTMVAVFVCLQESWHTPPSSLRLAGQTGQNLARGADWRESGLRDYSFLSSCLPSLPLPLLSFFPFSPSTTWTANKLRRQAFKNYVFPSSVGVGLQPARLPNSMCNCNNRGSVSGRRPTREGKRHWRLKRKKKRQRQKHAHRWQQLTRAQFQEV